MADDGLWARLQQMWTPQASQPSLWQGIDPANEHVRFKTASPLVNITDEDIDRGINVAMSAGPGSIRSLPANNYLGPISKHTDTLYREMHPTEALESLPGSVSYGGSGPGGIARKFYADNPDLATGQGSNRGVRVQYDAQPFEGTINTRKPAWDFGYQNGSAEYVAAPRPGANIRDAVQSFEVDPSALSRVEKAQYQRVISNLEGEGWDIKQTPDKIIVSKP